jgi:hypothetical protein
MSFFVKSEATHLPHYILDHSCLLGIAGTKECNKVKKNKKNVLERKKICKKKIKSNNDK